MRSKNDTPMGSGVEDFSAGMQGKVENFSKLPMNAKQF
jgi:hypothetical protein